MDILLAVCVVLLLLISAADFGLTLFLAWRPMERRREERTEAKVEEASNGDAERKMDEGFQNIMMYGGSLAEFMGRKDE